jgi:PAS domain S-box-containing protein
VNTKDRRPSDATEIQFKTVIETARVFILYYTPEGIITYLNPYGEEVGGYTWDEAVGKSFYDLYVTENNRDSVRREIKRVLEGGVSINTYVGPMLTKYGEEKAMLWSGSRTVDPDGRVTGVVASGIDMTELQVVQRALAKSEDLYRSLVDHSLAGIFIVQDGKFVFANKRAEELAGYTLDEVAEMDALSLVLPADRPLVAERMMRRLAGESAQERYEHTMITKNGEHKTVEIWGTVIDYRGRNAILATVIDITDRKRTEEARLQAEREIERHKARFYKDTIRAITQGALEIREPEEVEPELRGATEEVQLAVPQDIRTLRYAVRALGEREGVTRRRLDAYLLAVGEAAANALKHAGGGKALAGVRDGSIWTAIIDNGPGIDTLVLSQAVFRKGFSTKPSLGLGYAFILNGSDCVLLSTTRTGTTVILKLDIVSSNTHILAGMPDMPAS